jgi:hypothetical protein
MKKILLTSLLIISPFLTQAQQFSFGPQLGFYADEMKAEALCDSILIIENNGDGQHMLGLFAEYELTKKWRVRAELNSYKVMYGYVVYDLTDIGFLGPVNKTITTTARNIEVPLSVSFTPLAYKLAKLHLFGGLSANFRFERKEDKAYEFPYSNQELEDVSNVLHQGIYKPLVFYYSYGLRLEVWRFFVSGEMKSPVVENMVNPLKVWGRQFDFYTTDAYLFFKLGYRFDLARLQ